MRKITSRQREIFNFIRQNILVERRPPTIIEIKDHFNLASNQGIIDHLTALEKKGYIKRLKKSRGIILLKSRGFFPILGRVAAGNPIDAEEFHEGNLSLEELFDAENSFVIQVKGDSMKDAGIFDGDYVIVRQQNQVEHGEIAVVIIDGEATVKRVLFEQDKIILKPDNDAYEPMILNPDSDSFISGKVVGVLRKL